MRIRMMKRLLSLLVVVIILSGCTLELTNWLAVLPLQPLAAVQGDAAQGENLFKHGTNGSPPCVSCHALQPGGFSLGPVMAGIAARAGERVPGLSAEAYLHQSIIDPEAYVVPGFRPIMYPKYAEHFSERDIADLIAFLMTL